MSKTELRGSDNQLFSVSEGQSCDFVLTPTDPDGAAIDANDLLTLTLTLYDDESDAVINSREDQDILDANGGTIEEDLTVTVRLDGDDNVIVGSASEDEIERHVARFEYTYNDGEQTRTGKAERVFGVKKLASVE